MSSGKSLNLSEPRVPPLRSGGTRTHRGGPGQGYLGFSMGSDALRAWYKGSTRFGAALFFCRQSGFGERSRQAWVKVPSLPLPASLDFLSLSLLLHEMGKHSLSLGRRWGWEGGGRGRGREGETTRTRVSLGPTACQAPVLTAPVLLHLILPPPALCPAVSPDSRRRPEAQEGGTLAQGQAASKLRQENPSCCLQRLPLALLLG